MQKSNLSREDFNLLCSICSNVYYGRPTPVDDHDLSFIIAKMVRTDAVPLAFTRAKAAMTVTNRMRMIMGAIYSAERPNTVTKTKKENVK